MKIPEHIRQAAVRVGLRTVSGGIGTVDDVSSWLKGDIAGDPGALIAPC